MRASNATRSAAAKLRLRAAVAVALVLGALGAAPVLADSCTLVNRDQAERAVALLGAAGEMRYQDWLKRVPVAEVRWTRSGFLYQVEANGTGALDLAAVYVPAADGTHFDNLGALLGCAPAYAPRRVPREVFAERPVAPYRPDEDAWQPPRALLGLLELPALERAWYQGAQGAPAAPVAVYEQPSRDARVRRSIAVMSELPYLEYGYERPGAIVLEQREGWYRVELAQGGGWVAAADAGPFHAVASLVAENLAHLTIAWDGRLQRAPGDAAESRWMRPVWRRQLGGEVPVNVTATRSVAGVLWLQVEILSPSPCSGEEPSALASGWVPAHGAAGTMNVWFSSRGC